MIDSTLSRNQREDLEGITSEDLSLSGVDFWIFQIMFYSSLLVRKSPENERISTVLNPLGRQPHPSP